MGAINVIKLRQENRRTTLDRSSEGSREEEKTGKNDQDIFYSFETVRH